MAFEATAETVADLVDQGNAAYAAQDYDAAIAAYDEAAVETPESPHIYYNKGTALYQKGDYTAASKAFEKAAVKSKDIKLEAKSKFNRGNCSFREAERQQDSDLNKALEACETSIRFYQEALSLDPEMTEAAKNVEVVRLIMKNILDEIQKQKEAAKQQQQAAQQIKEKLQELIKRQQQALDRNRKLQTEDQSLAASKIRDLSQDQKEIRQQTEDLIPEIPKACGQPPAQQKNPVEQHLKNAVTEQEAASGNLDQSHIKEAETNQEKAVKELKDALASLEKDQGKQGQQPDQQGSDGSQQDQSQPEKEQPSAEENPQDPAEPDQEQGHDDAAQMSEDAQNILDEEKENQEQRKIRSSGRYKSVDKDW